MTLYLKKVIFNLVQRINRCCSCGEEEKEWPPLSELCCAAGARLGFILFQVTWINHGRSCLISILQKKMGSERKWLSRLMGRVETKTEALICKIKTHGSSTLTLWKSEDVNCLTMRERGRNREKANPSCEGSSLSNRHCLLWLNIATVFHTRNVQWSGFSVIFSIATFIHHIFPILKSLLLWQYGNKTNGFK